MGKARYGTGPAFAGSPVGAVRRGSSPRCTALAALERCYRNAGPVDYPNPPLGSANSRRRSPTMLSDRTSSKRAAAGRSEIHHSPLSR